MKKPLAIGIALGAAVLLTLAAVLPNVLQVTSIFISDNAGTDVVLGGTNASNGGARWKVMSGALPEVVHHTSSTIVVSNNVLRLLDGLLTVGNTDITGTIFETAGEDISFTSSGLYPTIGSSTLVLGSQGNEWADLWTIRAYASQYLTPYNGADFIPTNNASSNLTINFAAGPSVRDLYITNNITITNIVPPQAGFNSSVKLRIHPQLIPRGLLLPTPGGNQFGVRLLTNANNPIWPTLTNGVGYRLIFDAYGTNIDVTIAEWK